MTAECLMCGQPLGGARRVPAVCSSRCRAEADVELRRLASRRRQLSGEAELTRPALWWHHLLVLRQRRRRRVLAELEALTSRVTQLLAVQYDSER